MYSVLNCLTTEHDLRLVVVAGIICFLASLVAIKLLRRARATAGQTRIIWILTAGLATGSGIWATHFIAMLAYDPGVGIAYNLWLTVLSLLGAAIVTGLGLGLTVYYPGSMGSVAWGRHRRRWASPACITLVLRRSSCRVTSIGTRRWWRPRSSAGMLFGSAAMLTAQRRRSVTWTSAAALLLTLAIVSHHFIAMGAIEIIPDPTRLIDASSISPTSLATAIASVATAILSMSLLGASTDRRVSEQNLRFAAALNNMGQGLLMFDSAGRLVLFNQPYLLMYGISPEKVKAGCSLVDLLRLRKAAGTFKGDPDKYVAKLADEAGRFRGDPDANKLGEEGLEIKLTELPDGRTISITNRSMPRGGWVSTHQDITEQRRQDQERDRLAAQEERRADGRHRHRRISASRRDHAQDRQRQCSDHAHNRHDAVRRLASGLPSAPRAPSKARMKPPSMSRPPPPPPRSCPPRSTRSAASSARPTISSASR